jgi:hypothetical protein
LTGSDGISDDAVTHQSNLRKTALGPKQTIRTGFGLAFPNTVASHKHFFLSNYALTIASLRNGLQPEAVTVRNLIVANQSERCRLIGYECFGELSCIPQSWKFQRLTLKTVSAIQAVLLRIAFDPGKLEPYRENIQKNACVSSITRCPYLA